MITVRPSRAHRIVIVVIEFAALHGRNAVPGGCWLTYGSVLYFSGATGWQRSP